MTRWTGPLAAALLLLAAPLFAQAPPSNGPPLPDLTEFRTVATAVKAAPTKATSAAVSQPGYLGLSVDVGQGGRLTVAAVEPRSPAESAGVKTGDVVRTLDGHPADGLDRFRDLLQAHSPGEKLALGLERAGKPLELTAALTAPSRPLSDSARRAVLGAQTRPVEGGLRVVAVNTGSPAEKAGLQTGDVIKRLDTSDLAADPDRFQVEMSAKQPGDKVMLYLERDGKPFTKEVTLTADDSDPGRAPRWDDRGPVLYRKDVYRLAVVPIAYPDQPLNDKVKPADWEKALFSKGTFTDKNATGQQVFGSVHDFYQEISCGHLRLEGKVFDGVKVARKRNDYGAGTARSSPLLSEALDQLLERDGKEALKGYDGVFFVYAGGRIPGTNRGGIYWPHKGNLSHKGQRWNYFIVPEGGDRMTNISVICHEFGHMLGLPDLYARPENPGSEGLGVWCTMSNQLPNGRPQHFSAWCKERLGWLKPTVIDPTVKQKLILAPVEKSAMECFKVLLRPDGSEYLLLEVRSKRGYDTGLPGEGLLVWRVMDNHPVLEESHGIAGPSGPMRFLSMVPYPSAANNAFTPSTTPSSKSLKGGGLPVHITNIRRLPDGRVTFLIGYEFM